MERGREREREGEGERERERESLIRQTVCRSLYRIVAICRRRRREFSRHYLPIVEAKEEAALAQLGSRPHHNSQFPRQGREAKC